jgi:hypothetical protein
VTDEFYSLFYLGLFAEVRGEPEKAQAYMKRAVQTEYANFMGRGDYMTACARVSVPSNQSKRKHADRRSHRFSLSPSSFF